MWGPRVTLPSLDPCSEENRGVSSSRILFENDPPGKYWLSKKNRYYDFAGFDLDS